jgi:imidazole glycerol-phosphate synthase subunit HisH
MDQKNVGILNYGMGNILSVKNSLDFLNVKNEIIINGNNLKNFTHIILPGVGSFKKAMNNLNEKNFITPLKDYIDNSEKKLLGICLGMQLLGKSSTENGFTMGLNLIDIEVKKFSDEEVGNLKVPHVGFNAVKFNNDNIFFKDIKDGSDFYFVHSFRMKPKNLNKDFATCNYGLDFLAAFKKNNIFGTQFHPEKSQINGIKIIKNFLEI